MPDTITLTRMAEKVAENLHGSIEAMYPVHTYEYDNGESESHYVVLVKQPNRGDETHWCVHKVGHHSDGQVGIIGSGSYCMENASRARELFIERIGEAAEREARAS